MPLACPLKINKPYISGLIYKKIVPVEISVSSANICRMYKRWPCQCQQGVCKGAFAVQGFEVEFVLTLHRFKAFGKRLFKLFRYKAKQLPVVLSQIVGLQLT